MIIDWLPSARCLSILFWQDEHEQQGMDSWELLKGICWQRKDTHPSAAHLFQRAPIASHLQVGWMLSQLLVWLYGNGGETSLWEQYPLTIFMHQPSAVHAGRNKLVLPAVLSLMPVSETELDLPPLRKTRGAIYSFRPQILKYLLHFHRRE